MACSGTSLVAQMVKRLPTMWETWIQSLGRVDTLEVEMATHTRILGWKIPWMEESGRLQFMGLQRVRHDWVTSLYFLLHVLCSFITCVGSCDYHHSQGPEQFHHHIVPSYGPFIVTHTSTPYPFLDSRQPLICSSLLQFFISKMLYKWGHTVCNFCRLTLFIQCNSLETRWDCCIYS